MAPNTTQQKSLKLVMPYHNNLFDTVKALQQIAQVEVLTPKPFDRVIYEIAGIRITRVKTYRLLGRVYSPTDLFKKISPSTTHVLIKGPWLPQNSIPRLVALIRGTKLLSFSSRAMLADIPACIDPARFQRKDSATFTTQSLKLITIAKFQARKNIPVLVRAVAALTNQYPHLAISLTIIGVRVEPAEYTRTQRLVNALGLGSHVALHDELGHAETKQLLAEADIFILPASREPLGYATLEAMATSLPVVITNEVGAKKTVKDGRNGYIIPAGSTEALVAALKKFLASGQVDIKKLADFGAASRHIIDTKHSPQVFLRHVNKLL